jgi:hypothetical protein
MLIVVYCFEVPDFLSITCPNIRFKKLSFMTVAITEY